jgi:putative N6-adenine-specific DNA methylase
MKEKFEMVAKTFQGLEDVLAEELRNLGAEDVEPGRRMVAFTGDLEMLYKANLCCRTALRILKPVYKFTAADTDQLYERTKEFDWSTLMSVDSTFSIDTVAFSDGFTHSRFVTYRVKDAIVDWFKDRYGEDKRPGVRLQDADVMINVHISGSDVTLSLDSSGESLHKRGYRVAQTEAPINEVLAAGIILRSGWRGESPLVDPMCGSGTFLIEAALIAANINPGVYRSHFSFENWNDFDQELFDRLYNDDSAERDFDFKIYGADISPKAIEIAERNIKSAGVGRMIELQTRPLSSWTEAPEGGVLVTNPPYGERISADDMDGLYELIGQKLKNVFKGYHAWIIAAKNEYISKIGLAPSVKIPILNGSIECELREYVIFEGDYKSFRRSGGRLRELEEKKTERREERRERRSGVRSGVTRGRFGDKKGDKKDDKTGGRKGFGKGPKKEFKKDFKGDSKRDFRSGDRRDFKKDFKSDDRREFAGNDRREFKKEGPKHIGRVTSESFRPGTPGAGKTFRNRDERKPFAQRDDRFTPRTEAPENPFAARRSEDALKQITGKRPSIAVMRSRRKN